MGCCLSNLSDNAEIYTKIPQLRSWMREFKALALTEKSVEKFWQIYKKIDIDGSGTIEIKEMLVHFDVDRTKFTKRVFGIFDEDNSGEIDLREFILALWNYCTLGKATLVIFAFDLYDKDGSGIIDSQELQLMLKEVYGRAYDTNVYAKRIMENIQGMQVDAVDIDVFRKFVKKHPALLFPAFEMQNKMQTHTLGVSYWKRLGEKRLRLSSGQFVPIKKFMEMHLETLAHEDKQKIALHTKNNRGYANSGSRRKTAVDAAGVSNSVSNRRGSVKAIQRPDMPPVTEGEVLDASLNEALVANVPDRGSIKDKESLKNFDSTKGNSKDRSAKARRMSSIDVSMTSKESLSADQGPPLEVGPPSVIPYKEEDVSARRRNSTMTSLHPSSSNVSSSHEIASASASPDVYDALVSAARDAGAGGDGKRKKTLKSVATGVKVAAKYSAKVGTA